MKRNYLAAAITSLTCIGHAQMAIAADDAAAIHNGQFELGLYTGILAVEDFGSEAVAGAELTWHLRPGWLLQGSYGRAEVGAAAFETSQREFLSSDERDFEYLAVTGGYEIYNGRSFWNSDARFNSAIHVLAGPERVSFAGGDEWGLSAGLSYRMVFAGWLTANVDFREHIVERDFLGDDKNTMNTELRIGINALF